MTRRRTERPRFVYFIEAGKGGPIKIGVAVDVEARLRDLQCANPNALNLIVAIPGGYDDENRLHRRFKAERKSGEWFAGNGAVRAFALSLVDADEAARTLVFRHDEMPKKPKRDKSVRRPWLRYTPQQLHAMFHVAGSSDIYLSREAEELMHAYRSERHRFGLHDDDRHVPHGI